jgi:long-chain fatty acid transport protein
VPIVFENPGAPASVLTINYDDAIRYSLGFEWYATRALTLRTGFACDETPIASAAFRTPRIPDNDRYFLSAGLKWSMTSFLDFDLAYAHLFVNQAGVDLLDDQGHLLHGYFDASVDIVSASLTFRWGRAA